MTATPSDSPLPAERSAEIFDLAAAMVTVLLMFFVLSDWTGVPRLVLTSLFTFLVPGRAIVRNWPQVEGWADLAMSIVLSLGTLMLLTLITLWLHYWHPVWLFEGEAMLSLFGLGIAFVRRRGANLQQR
jgi:uncharacterized membrane protein